MFLSRRFKVVIFDLLCGDHLFSISTYSKIFIEFDRLWVWIALRLIEWQIIIVVREVLIRGSGSPIAVIQHGVAEIKARLCSQAFNRAHAPLDIDFARAECDELRRIFLSHVYFWRY